MSEPRSEAADEPADDDDLTTPIKMGDYITLRGIHIDGYLNAEGVLSDACWLNKTS